MRRRSRRTPSSSPSLTSRKACTVAPQGLFELLALVLGPAQALGRLAVERVVAQGLAEFLDRAVEVLAPEEELAVQLVVRRVGQVLGLGDLQALDGPGVLPLLGVEVGQAQEVGGVDGVAPEAFAQACRAGSGGAAAPVLLLALADLGQGQLDAQVLGVQPQGQEEEVRRLFVPARSRRTAARGPSAPGSSRAEELCGCSCQPSF